MPAFTPASEQRLTPTVRRAASFAVKDAPSLKRGRSTAGAEFNTSQNRFPQEAQRTPELPLSHEAEEHPATPGRLPATDGRWSEGGWPISPPKPNSKLSRCLPPSPARKASRRRMEGGRFV